MNIAQNHFPSSSHLSIELSSYFNHYDESSEHLPLLHVEGEYSNPSNSESKTKLPLLQAMNWIIKVHILLGERSIWYFEKIMLKFRHTRQMKIFMQSIALFQQLILIFNAFYPIPKRIFAVFFYFSIAILVLYILSGIYHWIIGRKFFVESGSYIGSEDIDENEGLKELLEKDKLMNSLAVQVNEFTDRNQNIPQDLALAILLAMTDSVRLSDELFVASEFLSSQGGLSPAEIQNIPIETYCKMTGVENESNMCSICIKSFKHKEKLRRLRCGHRFHVRCVDDWLKQLKACPNCKVIM